MDSTTIKSAIKAISHSFKRGLKYFWTKITGKQGTHTNIISVEYTDSQTERKIKLNNNTIIKREFRASWKKQYCNVTPLPKDTPCRYYPKKNNRQSSDIILTQKITLEEVQEKIHNRKDTTPGTDHITMAIIKMFPKQYIKELTNIYNCCLKGAPIPKEWQEGQIFLNL